MVTRLGWWILAQGLVSLALGLWLNWQEFLQVGVLSLLLVAVALLWVRLPGRTEVGLAVRPHHVTEGGRPAVLTVSARAGAMPTLGPRIRVPLGSRSVDVGLPFLAPGAACTEDVELSGLGRGVYEVGPAEQVVTDLLGLARRDLHMGGLDRLFVRPRTVNLDVYAGGLSNDLEGVVSDQLSMSDLAFHALREYTPGDDLRHVHWRSSARAGILQVRQYHETRRGHVTVLLDHERGSYRGRSEFETAVSAATSLALRVVRDDLDTVFRCGPHGASGRSPEAVLDAACRFTRGEDGYAAVAHSVAAETPATGLVVQVSGSRREPAHLRSLSAAFARDAASLLVRVDGTAEPRITAGRSGSEVVLADLTQLRGLVAGTLR